MTFFLDFRAHYVNMLTISLTKCFSVPVKFPLSVFKNLEQFVSFVCILFRGVYACRARLFRHLQLEVKHAW